MFEVLFAVAIAGGFVALTSHLVRRGRRLERGSSEPSLLDAPIRELADLLPDDVLLYDGKDFVVAEVTQLTASGRSWVEARVEDASVTRWVMVGRREEDELCWGEEVKLPGLGSEPSEAVDFQGEVFHLERQGTAERQADQAQIRFWDYGQPGDPRLWIRQEAEVRRIFAGERVARHLVEFLPGS